MHVRVIKISLVLILFIIFLWKAAPIEIFTHAYYHGATDDHEIALAFDDGPDWGEEALIAALNQAGIKATFFWTWQKVEMLNAEDPERFIGILQLLREGEHEVGIHGFACHISSNIASRVLGLYEPEDLAELKQNFSNLLHREIRLYRPHGVRLGRELYTEIEDSGLKLIFGSPHYQIGQSDPAPSYLNAFNTAEPGTIISGHDSKDCYSDYGLALQLAKIIPDIEKILAHRELSVVTVSEILRLDQSLAS